MRFHKIGLYLVFILVSGAIILTGCGKRHSVALQPPVKYYRFAGGRRAECEMLVSFDSVAFQAIQAWLRKERNWAIDVRSYAPREMLESDLVRLNYTESQVVLSIRDNAKDNWSQFSCKSDSALSESFERLRCELGTEKGSTTQDRD